MKSTAAASDFPCETCAVRDKAICAALDDEELRHLEAISTAVSLHAGQAIFREGDENTFLFNVVTGAVRLSKLLPDGRRQITGFLFPGDLLGLSVAGSYAYTAEAISETSLCRFGRARLTDISERFPNLEHRLLDLASNELDQAQEHILVLGRKTAAERVATVLLRLVDRIGDRADAGSKIDLPMTREDIGDYAGLSIETVSRILSQFRKIGILKTPSARHIEIPDTEALMQLSGDL